jgi:hypothetical protein
VSEGLIARVRDAYDRMADEWLGWSEVSPYNAY